MLTLWPGSDFRQHIGIVLHNVFKDSIPFRTSTYLVGAMGEAGLSLQPIKAELSRPAHPPIL